MEIKLCLWFLLFPVCFANYGPDGLPLDDESHDHSPDHDHSHDHANNHDHAHNHDHSHNHDHAHNHHGNDDNPDELCREVLVQDCQTVPVTRCVPNSGKSSCTYKHQQKCEPRVEQVCTEVRRQECRQEESCNEGCSCSDKLCSSSVRQQCHKVEEEQCSTKCEKICTQKGDEKSCDYKPVESCVTVEKEECNGVQELEEVCDTVYEEVCVMKGSEACTSVEEEDCQYEDVCEVEYQETCETIETDDCVIENCDEICEESDAYEECEDKEEQQCETLYDRVCDHDHYGKSVCQETPRQECKTVWRNVCQDVKKSVCKVEPNKVCSPKSLTTCKNTAVPKCSSARVCTPVQKISCSYHNQTCSQVAREKCSLRPVTECWEGKKGLGNCRLDEVCDNVPTTECRQDTKQVCEDVMLEMCPVNDGLEEGRVVQLPPGVSPEDCPNFPFCGGSPPGGESCSSSLEEVCVAKWVNVCEDSN